MSSDLKRRSSAIELVTSLGLAAVLLSSCTGGRTEHKTQPNIELIQDMMEQSALKAQDFEPDERTKAGSRQPPEGTVAIGHPPYKYKGNPEGAARNLKNPFDGQMTPEVLSIGQRNFEIYCAVCHGNMGHGDGPVAPKMALKPPSLIADKVVKMGDGQIYHIITDGQGVMASYAYQMVDERDRWAVVNYIRNLQKLSQGN